MMISVELFEWWTLKVIIWININILSANEIEQSKQWSLKSNQIMKRIMITKIWKKVCLNCVLNFYLHKYILFVINKIVP